MKADLILTGGSILTVDKNNSIHEAVAIIDNKIAQVGSSEEIKKLQGPETKTIELWRDTLWCPPDSGVD